MTGDLLDRMHGSITAFVGSGDIEKGNFVGALIIVATRNFNRVTGIADVDKVHAFNDAAVVHIQTGNNAFCQCHNYPAALLIAILLGFGHIQRAFVDSTTGNGAENALFRDFFQRANVVHIGNAA